MIIKIRNLIGNFIYKNILKKIFFLQDPENVHNYMVKSGEILSKTLITRYMIKILFDKPNSKILTQNIKNITFKNPIGLSAGFDKDAQLTQILDCLNFGFEEIGSITAKCCQGNPKPRLWRLKKSGSLLVYYGLKNDGADKIKEKLKNKKFKIPIGVSIAKTNCKETVDDKIGIDDYFYSYKKFKDFGSYTTINISCPNVYGGQPFTDAKRYKKLMKKIFSIPKTKPIFIKLSPDLSNNQIDDLLKISNQFEIDGFIISNLTKNRENKQIHEKYPSANGGISGKAVNQLSNKMISYVYKKTKGKYIIIASGGVFNAKDAYEKIKLGASLIQLITGMIFQGPFIISQINLDLEKMLKKDGFTNINEAIGIDNK